MAFGRGKDGKDGGTVAGEPGSPETCDFEIKPEQARKVAVGHNPGFGFKTLRKCA